MRHHTLFWGSSYDRGLDILLFMWPDIIKEYPDAKLHIAYGWDLFDALRGGNPERLQWKQNVQKMMQQPGIIHWGRVGKDKLKSIREQCGIWAYPTYFPEINCITALECQKDGVVPVTMDSFALSETVQEGILVPGDISKLETQDWFKKELLSLMRDKVRWSALSKDGKKFAESYRWENIAKKWEPEFKKPIAEPMVSVITATIRSGFWNVMAHNLAQQTYKNLEWIIVDDYPEDREFYAIEYAKKYGLKVKYIRGDLHKSHYKRLHALVRANNKGWKASEGELLVYLQDFMLIPKNGIEMLVDVYRHHPNSLIAPVDERWNSKQPNLSNKEDWWEGDTDVLTTFDWRNVRKQFLGIRETRNPFDFEMNYGAIPKHILDDLNGWWEFFDNGLGYDNTEIAYRALQKGYSIIIDDRNEAIGINLWPYLKGTSENIIQRDRTLSPPYYLWFTKRMKEGKLPVVRDEKIDESITISYSVPKEIPDEKAADWINQNAERIVEGWLK